MTTLCACSVAPISERDAPSFYKDFNRVKTWRSPEHLRYTDYRAIASAYHALVFNSEARGEYLPLSWHDAAHNTIGIAAYVGDGRAGKDGAQEAVTVIAAVYSAALLALDVAPYLNSLNAFFSADEGIVLNNPGGSSADASMWYLLYPAILYAQVSMLCPPERYPEGAVLRAKTLTTIESWFSAYQVIRATGGDDFDFDITGFDFTKNAPYSNGIWKEPDAAAGMALLFTAGHAITGAQKYLDAAIDLMNYIENYFGSPLYEVLLYYAPSLAARLNALCGTNYDITRALNRVFDGTSIPRGGWGAVSGKWGDYEVNGLFGSKSDGGGYAFSMNTFAAAGAIAPLARYDARYARAIGAWLVNLHSNARYFFASQTDPSHQSSNQSNPNQSPKAVPPEITAAVPFEGIRNHRDGLTPWFGGDPTVYGWADTDFSLYSGAHTGILGALFASIDTAGVMCIDLRATDLLAAADDSDKFPMYLLYNPSQNERQVQYAISALDAIDLFDTVSNTLVASGVTESVLLTVPADGALVIVEIPAGTVISHNAGIYTVDGFCISRDLFTLTITGAKNNQTVSGRFSLKAVVTGNANASSDISTGQCTLTIDGKQFPFDAPAFESLDQTISLNTRDFTKGEKLLRVTMTAQNGATDYAELRLRFK
ncbi:MAG: hypothetical protein Ta2A_15540 [Treponemataceae bacterium]|nr:MAG: hypothetical protein Ta2A_15540 [Treponemataceae bacterium]